MRVEEPGGILRQASDLEAAANTKEKLKEKHQLPKESNKMVKQGEHIHDLQLQVRQKTHNLNRLEAQRNDLNSKGQKLALRFLPT
jgi:hypothetical protein